MPVTTAAIMLNLFVGESSLGDDFFVEEAWLAWLSVAGLKLSKRALIRPVAPDNIEKLLRNEPDEALGWGVCPIGREKGKGLRASEACRGSWLVVADDAVTAFCSATFSLRESPKTLEIAPREPLVVSFWPQASQYCELGRTVAWHLGQLDINNTPSGLCRYNNIAEQKTET